MIEMTRAARLTIGRQVAAIAFDIHLPGRTECKQCQKESQLDEGDLQEDTSDVVGDIRRSPGGVGSKKHDGWNGKDRKKQ